MNFEYIDRYLSGEMNTQEKLDFEKRMCEDPAFRNEVAQYQDSIRALKVYSTNELKQRLKQRQASRNAASTSYKKWLRLFMAVAAVVFLYWFNYRSSVKTVSPDSQILMDTVLKSTPLLEIDSNSIHQDTIQAKTEKQISREDLFAMNFKPYSDDLLEEMARGEGDKTPFEQFQYEYVSKNYTESIKLFETLDASLQSNDNVVFIKVNALMATGDIRTSSQLLERIIKNKKTRHLKESLWLYALCLIKEGKIEAAKSLLKNPALKNDNPALKLLQQI